MQHQSSEHNRRKVGLIAIEYPLPIGPNVAVHLATRDTEARDPIVHLKEHVVIAQKADRVHAWIDQVAVSPEWTARTKSSCTSLRIDREFRAVLVAQQLAEQDQNIIPQRMAQDIQGIVDQVRAPIASSIELLIAIEAQEASTPASSQLVILRIAKGIEVPMCNASVDITIGCRVMGHIDLRTSAEALVHLTGLQTTVLIQIIVDQALARHETPRANCTLNMSRTVLIAAAPIMAIHKVAS